MGARLSATANEGVYFDTLPSDSGGMGYRPIPYPDSDPTRQGEHSVPLPVCMKSACHADELWWEETPQLWALGCVDRDDPDPSWRISDNKDPHHTCSTVVKGDCPVLSGGVSATGVQALDPKAYDGRRMRCYYDAKEVGSSCETATEFARRKKLGSGIPEYEDWFDPATMNTLCSRRGTPALCPKNPNGESEKDSQGAVCSELLTCNLCKEWANSKWVGATTQSDNIIEKWCTELHPKDPACKCVNRMSDDIYRQTQSVTTAAAGCFWKSCIDKNFQYDLVQSKDRGWGGCPSQLCANIIQNFGGQIDIGTLNSVINCGGTTQTGTCTSQCGQHGTCAASPSGVGSVCVCEEGWSGPGCTVSDSIGKDTSVGILIGSVVLLGIGAAIIISTMKKPGRVA